MEILVQYQGEVLLDQNFLKPEEADILYEVCYNQLPWTRDQITIFGKKHWIPRKQAYMADSKNNNYGYSGHQMKIHEFHPEINILRKKIEKKINASFNAMLANLYEHGQHSNGWHSDDEKELGVHPIIASISLGQTRKFKIKHKKQKITKDIFLEHGSLLVMKGSFQENWKHTIPKTAKEVQPRINLTFRKIIS